MEPQPAILKIDLGGGLVKKSLARQLYEALERAIIHAAIPPATRLAEEAIATAFGVSRSPAREAIVELERIGLAERLPNRDRRVAVPSEAFIRDTFEVWTLMETERLNQASLVADPATLARIDALMAAMESPDSDDPQRLRGLMAEFHAVLQQGCPNRQMHRAADDWYRYILWFRNLYFDYHAEIGDAGISEHRRIVECFRRRDRAGLSVILRRHIESHRDHVLAAWRTSSAPALSASTRTLDFTLEADIRQSA